MYYTYNGKKANSRVDIFRCQVFLASFKYINRDFFNEDRFMRPSFGLL